MNRLTVQRMTAKHIICTGDVSEFIYSCIHELNLNFHPDTDFHEYFTNDDSSSIDTPAFTSEEAEELQKSLDECFEVCDVEGVDIYELALNERTKGMENEYLDERRIPVHESATSDRIMKTIPITSFTSEFIDMHDTSAIIYGVYYIDNKIVAEDVHGNVHENILAK